jgi:hypothetical protein
VADSRLAAFVGCAEQSLPHFTGEEGIMPQLEPILGVVGEGADRYASLLESGCRTARELTAAWQTMATEGEQMAAFLEKELDGPLKDPVEAAGQGSSDGSTRHRVTGYLEEQRAAVMCRALQLHPDQTARPVWAFPQLDRLSQAWIRQLPGSAGLSQLEFSETMARLLCLPSPLCAARVGEPLGERGLAIDPFGDNVLSVSNIPGGSFTARHDLVKTKLHDIILDSGLRLRLRGVWGLSGPHSRGGAAAG